MNQILADLIQMYMDGLITSDEFTMKVIDEAYQKGIYQHADYKP